MILGTRSTLASVVMLMWVSSAGAAQITLTEVTTPPGEESVPCVPDRQPCLFTDIQGDNTYTVTKEMLTRAEGGRIMVSVPLAGQDATKILLVAANRSRSQIVIALEQTTVPVSGRLGGFLSPDQVQRSHWLTIRNPKTGEDIKSVDLGMLRPTLLGTTPSGDYVWVAGDELQLRRREVRAYNARSGKLEYSGTVDQRAAVKFYDRGFLAGRLYYSATAAAASGGADRRHNSPNAFSIAEFTVRKTTSLKPDPAAAIGVVGFQGGTQDLRDMLDSALSVKLAGAGFTVVERQRLKDVLQEARFQNLGLTDSAKATELGRLLNAQFLLFGQVQSVGTTSSLVLRLVGVSDGAVQNGIELQCRDCAPDDYLQGLTFLVQDWVE